MNKFKQAREKLNLFLESQGPNADSKIIEHANNLRRYIDSQEKYYNSIPKNIRTDNTLNNIIQKIYSKISQLENINNQQELRYQAEEEEPAEIIDVAYLKKKKIIPNNDELTTKLKTAGSEISELKDENFKLKNDIAVERKILEAKNEELKQLKNMEAELNSATESNNKKISDIKLLMVEKNEIENELNSLKVKFDKLETNVTQLQSEKSELNEKLESVTSKLQESNNSLKDKEELKNERDSLIVQLNSLNVEFDKLKTNVTQLQSEKSELNNQLQIVMSELQESNNSLKDKEELKNERDSLQVEFDKLKHDTISQVEFDKLDSQLKSVNNELRYSKESNKNCFDEKERLEKERDSLRAQLEFLQIEFNESISSTTTQLHDEISNLNIQLKSANNHYLILQEENKELNNQLEDTKSKLNLCIETNSENIARIKMLNNENIMLENKIKTIESTIYDSDVNTNQLTNKISMLTYKLDLVKGELEVLKNANKSCLEDKRKLEENESKLKDEILKNTSTIDELRLQLDNKNEEISNLTQRLSDAANDASKNSVETNNKCSELYQQLTEANKKIEELTKDVEDCKKEIRDLTEEAAKCRNELALKVKEVEELTKSMEECRKELALKSQENEKYKKSFDEIESIHKEITEITEKYKSSNKQIESLKETLAQKTNELQIMTDKYNEREISLNNNRDRIRDLEYEISAKTKELDEINIGRLQSEPVVQTEYISPVTTTNFVQKNIDDQNKNSLANVRNKINEYSNRYKAIKEHPTYSDNGNKLKELRDKLKSSIEAWENRYEPSSYAPAVELLSDIESQQSIKIGKGSEHKNGHHNPLNTCMIM